MLIKEVALTLNYRVKDTIDLSREYIVLIRGIKSLIRDCLNSAQGNTYFIS